MLPPTFVKTMSVPLASIDHVPAVVPTVNSPPTVNAPGVTAPLLILKTLLVLVRETSSAKMPLTLENSFQIIESEPTVPVELTAVTQLESSWSTKTYALYTSVGQSPSISVALVNTVATATVPRVDM